MKNNFFWDQISYNVWDSLEVEMAPPQLFIKIKTLEKQLKDKEDVHVPEKKQEDNKEEVPEKKQGQEAGMRDLVWLILMSVGLTMVIGGVSFNKNDLYAN